MKKIVGIAAAAALSAGMLFADGPVANLNVAEFSGYGQAKWGVDLDAGQTGFENDEKIKLEMSLFDAGTKTTEKTGDIWGEFVIKAGNTQWWTHKMDKEIEVKGGQAGNGGLKLDQNLSFGVDTVKLHFGDKVYVGLRSGDTTVGAYKFDGAIRSADNGNAQWLSDVGPAGFSQGIVAGYGDDNFAVDVDLRSYKSDNTFYTSAYGIAAEAQLKDSNEFVSGLKVDAGIGYNLSSTYNDKAADGKVVKNKAFAFNFEVPSLVSEEDIADAKAYLKTLKDAYAANYGAAPELPENATWAQYQAYLQAQYEYEHAAAPTGAQKDDLDEIEKWEKDIEEASKATNFGDLLAAAATEDDPLKVNTLGYGVNVGYKFKIDDKYYVKPAVGFTGTVTNAVAKDVSGSVNSNNLVVGALFGWGDTADANAGVYFLDGDCAKKVTPGVSVVASIPLATVGKISSNGKTNTATINSNISAVIVPSVYLGDLVENLKFAAYSEMAMLKWVEDDKLIDTSATDAVVINGRAANKDRTFALAATAAFAYDVKADEITVTPKAGIRYANAAYVENNINSIAPLSSNKVFDGLGIAGKDEKGNNDYFNLKAGVDVNGLIPNATIFAEYASANLLNDTDYSSEKIKVNDVEVANPKYSKNGMYNVKLGTFNIGVKMSL